MNDSRSVKWNAVPVIWNQVVVTHNTPPSLACGLTSWLASRAWSRKADNSSLQWRSPADAPPLDTSSDKSCGHQVPRWDAVRRVSPQNRYRSLFMRKTSDKPNGPTFYKMPERCPSKLSRSQNRRKGNSLAWMPYGVLDRVLEQEKDSRGKTCKILIKPLV